ncbi:hypothetical protein F5Y06DRAFT_294413 [Hypoxylon sp. FL0890]|nr:hypothetical protein F5Y06DRAFT_294413 [Hypoxylon sp. FL0890]
MARVKRQKWVDVYDPVTGHHRPQSEAGGQLPSPDTVAKPPEQVREQDAIEVTEQPEQVGALWGHIDELILDQVAMPSGAQPIGYPPASPLASPTVPQGTDQEKKNIPKHMADPWEDDIALQQIVQEIQARQQQNDGQESSQPPAVNSDTDQGYFSKESPSPAPSGVNDKGESEETAVDPGILTDTYQEYKPSGPVKQARDTDVESVKLGSHLVGLPMTDHPNHHGLRSERDFRNQVPEDEGWGGAPLNGWNHQKSDSDMLTLTSAVYPGISSYLERYVKHWVQNAHEIIVDDLFPDSVQDPEACDIHPEVGVFMNPVYYPPTKRDGKSVKGANVTSKIRMIRRMREIAEKKQREIRKMEDQTLAQYNEELEAGENPKVIQTRGRAGSREIRIASHLRAAKLEDMEQVADIYNMEAEASYKLPDKQPVTSWSFAQIYHACIDHNLPFLVAIDGWYDKKNKKDQRVIGFIVMDIATRGLDGSYETRAAPCGKLTVVVHPEFRRKNICSAMLDAVFTCCSVNYSNRRGYEIVNPDKDGRHLVPQENTRKWHFIDIEVVVPSGASKEATKANKEFKWISEYLTRYFQMQLVYHDEKLFRDDRFDRDHQWLDRLTFRHQCRPLGS